MDVTWLPQLQAGWRNGIVWEMGRRWRNHMGGDEFQESCGGGGNESGEEIWELFRARINRGE